MTTDSVLLNFQKDREEAMNKIEKLGDLTFHIETHSLMTEQIENSLDERKIKAWNNFEDIVRKERKYIKLAYPERLRVGVSR